MRYSYPETKAMLIPFINEGSTGIAVGGFQSNIAREIEVDTPEMLLNMLEALDGRHSISEICVKFGFEEDELIELLDALQANGIISENNPETSGFLGREAEYYSRNINFFSWIDIDGLFYNYWDAQKALKQSKVLVLGCGGTGGASSISLARLGIGNLTIVDFDMVELSNLNRQIYYYEDIGKKKVFTLADHLQRINPFISVNPIEAKITCVEDIVSLGNDFDIVLCCIDKPKDILSIMEEYTKITGIARVLGGYASTIISSGLFTASSPSYNLVDLKSREDNYLSDQVRENKFWKWENAIISPVAYIAGNMLCNYVLFHQTKLGLISEGFILHMDMFNMNSEDFFYFASAEGIIEFQRK